MAFSRRLLEVVLLVVIALQVPNPVTSVTYDVGDDDPTGWGWDFFHVSDPDYKSWTSSKTFYVGDIIRFQYDPQYHNVMQVSHPDYVSCNITKPIATYTTGYDSITLKHTGHHYFICGVYDHCKWGGMKVIVNVLSPPVAPPMTPPTPTVVSTPASSADDHHHHGKNNAAVIHNVGDSAGWTTIGHVDYKKWAASNKFHVGDTLRFKYHAEYHNVMQVLYPDYVSCNTTRPLATYSTGDDYIPIKKGSHYYFICGKPGHCKNGMKLHIRPSPRAH